MLLCFSDGPRERARGVPADLSRERDGETRLERDGVDAMDLTPAATRCVVYVCVCVHVCVCVFCSPYFGFLGGPPWGPMLPYPIDCVFYV